MTEETQELKTFTFEDGEEHEIADLSDEGKILLNKIGLFENQKTEIISSANFELEVKDNSIAVWQGKLKEIVNKKEEKDESVSDKAEE